jgi:hypothetical protein
VCSTVGVAGLGDHPLESADGIVKVGAILCNIVLGEEAGCNAICYAIPSIFPLAGVTAGRVLPAGGPLEEGNSFVNVANASMSFEAIEK